MDFAALDRSAAKITPACHDIPDQLAVSLLLKAQLKPASLKNNRLPATLLNRPIVALEYCLMGVEFRFR